MGEQNTTRPSLQQLVDDIAATVRSEMGPGASLADVRDAVQVRAQTYLRSPEFRERKARNRRDRLRKQSGERALVVLDVLIAHDPARLIAAGAPPEQYTTEAGPIAERLRAVSSSDEAAQVVRDVLEEYLGESWGNMQQLAADVWEAWSHR